MLNYYYGFRYTHTRPYTHTYARKNSSIHTRTNTHTQTHIHTYTYRQTNSHTHTRTCAHTPTQTHTQCSFAIGGPSLWNHLPENIKEAGSMEFFTQILETLVFSQSFEIQTFLNFVTVPSTLFNLFFCKKWC